MVARLCRMALAVLMTFAVVAVVTGRHVDVDDGGELPENLPAEVGNLSPPSDEQSAPSLDNQLDNDDDEEIREPHHPTTSGEDAPSTAAPRRRYRRWTQYTYSSGLPCSYCCGSWKVCYGDNRRFSYLHEYTGTTKYCTISYYDRIGNLVTPRRGSAGSWSQCGPNSPVYIAEAGGFYTPRNNN